MDYSRKIAERQWNLPDKGELESRREETYIDDIIQKDHIQRKLLENLDGIHTVFDGGAGCGRFSILLAKQGCRVTHFDISQPMIDKARELAEKAGVLDRITFVRGALEDLSAYPDGAFDLAISFDAPVSYTYPHQERVIGELARIARKRIMISVSSRLGALPYLANPLQKRQFILDEGADDPFVQWCVASRKALVDGFVFDKARAEQVWNDGLLGGEAEIAEYEKGGAPWCITYTFLPDELERILRDCGVGNIRLSGPGAYGRTVPREILVKIMNDPAQKRDFLDFCYRFDSNRYVCGLGKDNLLAVGEIVRRSGAEAQAGVELRLLRPTPADAERIEAYRAEFPSGRMQVTPDPERIPGLDGLEDFESVKDWLAYCETQRGRISWYMTERTADGRIVGFCCLRHRLEYDDDDPEFASHIGYSIRPSERGKGYAKEQLRLVLQEAKALGIRPVRLVCRDVNIASRRTILANGGRYVDSIRGEESGLRIDRFDLP